MILRDRGAAVGEGATTRATRDVGGHRGGGEPTGSLATVAPLVSVLIPAFNHEDYIRRCLDSILADGYPNIEVVVLNDGSSDATQRIAQDWIIEHANSFTGGARLLQQENRGIVRTLNRLVSEARGEFITVLASDDCLCPGSIGARVDYLLAHPKYLAVFGDAAGIDANDTVTMGSVLEDKHRASREALRCDATRGLELILRWCVPGPVYLARRTVTDEIGTYDERYCFEDRNYYLRLIKADALGFIDRRVALYRIHGAPSRSRFSQLQRDHYRLEEDILPELHGLQRLALATDVGLRRLRRKEHPTLLTRFEMSMLFRLRGRMTACNRRAAALLTMAQRARRHA
jgi:GT2 family glycosyltransferase